MSLGHSPLHQEAPPSAAAAPLAEVLRRVVGLRAVALSRLLLTTDSMFYQLQYEQSGEERYSVEHYSPRTFQVRDNGQLVAVTVYKRGAEEVKRQLAQRDTDVLRWRSLAIALVSYLDHRPHG